MAEGVSAAISNVYNRMMSAKPPLERAARALCSLQGLPENTKFEGRPMWESFLPNARAALQAIRQPSQEMVAAADDLPCSLGTIEHWQVMLDVALKG